MRPTRRGWPVTPNGSRLVANTVVSAQPATMAAKRFATGATTCSQLSMIKRTVDRAASRRSSPRLTRRTVLDRQGRRHSHHHRRGIRYPSEAARATPLLGTRQPPTTRSRQRGGSCPRRRCPSASRLRPRRSATRRCPPRPSIRTTRSASRAGSRSVCGRQRTVDCDNAVRDHPERMHGLHETAQPLEPEILQHELPSCREEGRRHVRNDDLTTACRRHESSGSVHGSAVVVTVALERLTRVESHSKPEVAGGGQASAINRALRIDGGFHRIPTRRNAAATPSPPARRQGRRGRRWRHPRIASCRARRAHRYRVSLPERGGALDVGEQEGHRSRRST